MIRLKMDWEGAPTQDIMCKATRSALRQATIGEVAAVSACKHFLTASSFVPNKEGKIAGWFFTAPLQPDLADWTKM